MPVTIQPGFSEEHRADAAILYYEAFYGKLHRIFDPKIKAHALFERILDPDYAISAVSDDGRLLGIAGYKTSKGSLTGGGLKDLQQIYGLWGGMWRGLLAGFLERDLEPGVLLMDGICVAPDARGMGLGTRLLQAIKDTAVANSYRSVRLDVIDTNPRAAALYAREGFHALQKEDLGPLRFLFGFSTATRMEYAVPQQNR